MVSRTSTEPLYRQVLDQIRRRIVTGEWARGDRVPPERQLADLLGVSRITVRHAIRLASAEGLVEQRPGVGTFVGSADKVQQDLSEVRSFERTLAEQGRVATTDILGTERLISDLVLSGTLGIEPASPVQSLLLLGRGDSSPVVYYESYFALPLGREMVESARELHEAGRAFSTLDLYREASVTRVPTSMSQTIEAVSAPAELAERLVIDTGAALLAIESVMSDDEGPMEFRRAYYRADRYKFAARRRLVVRSAPVGD